MCDSARYDVFSNIRAIPIAPPIPRPLAVPGCAPRSRAFERNGGRRLKVHLTLTLLVSMLTGTKESSSQKGVVLEVPHIAQRPDFCGEACAEMALRQLGRNLDQDDVFAFGGIDPALGRGLTTPELKRALERIGFLVGPVWHEVDARNAARDLESEWNQIHADLLSGTPTIVCMRYDESPGTTEHFRLVVGYDPRSDEVIYHEPASTNGAYQRMKRARFVDLWPLKYDTRRWTVIRLRMVPGDIRSTTRTRGHSPADYAQHVRALKQRVPRGFSVVLEPPFVVVGDDPIEKVKGHATRTVRWAVDKLKQDYFESDPGAILDVWLFKDRASYEHHTRALFGDRPTTPYGYYSARHGALIMNISTGGGTLVHEIVHPFIEANFDGCPPWFNEGLGSLFEQSHEAEGHIRGLPNWRLEGLKAAVRTGRLPPFEALLSRSTREFYEDDPGTNYAQARYLLYYLQEKGLLTSFYRAFRRDRASDPTGYATLKSVLGEQDISKFQKRWEEFVLRLTFP